MVNDLKNTLLIGLTVLVLGSAAWWLGPVPTPAQQYVDTQARQDQPPSEPDVEVVPDDDNPGAAPDTPPGALAKPVQPSLFHLLGIDTARARLGKAIPTGQGITVGHVEYGPGQYMPDISSPNFHGVTFVERSGASRVSGHANDTARVIYGLTGLARGVDVVHGYDSRDWMRSYLNAGSPDPPVGGPIRLLTHSWISDARNAADVLRRVDWQIDTFDTVMCVGVNNGRQTPVPYLLGTAYNVIAVGTADTGGSSGGYTRLEVAGRCKPDIVGPRGLTSFTTPAVAACAARLLQAADEMTDESHLAGKAQVIKAVLLAGAVKPDGWQPAPGKPLDEHLGAGIVNFNNSLLILQAGPPSGSASAPGIAPGSIPGETASEPGNHDVTGESDSDPVRLPNRMGWDFRAIGPEQSHAYTFGLQAPMGEASIILTWHRRITGRPTDNTSPSRSIWYGLPRLADLDLHLYHTDENGEERELAVSQSKLDNVEHIYLTHLDPGRYRLEVTRPESVHEEPWDYALAWRVELLNASAE